LDFVCVKGSLGFFIYNGMKSLVRLNVDLLQTVIKMR